MQPPDTRPLQLRAHHLLCILKYQGKGYSSEFVHNMDRIWHEIRHRTHETVEPRQVADSICSACPHLADPETPTSCTFHESISHRDRRLLSLLGWEEGTILPLAETLELLRARHAELLDAVCRGCDWLEICQKDEFTL